MTTKEKTIRRADMKTAMMVLEVLKELAAKGDYISFKDAAAICADRLGHDVSPYTVQHLIAQECVPDWPPKPGAPRSVGDLQREVDDLRAMVESLEDRVGLLEAMQ